MGGQLTVRRLADCTMNIRLRGSLPDNGTMMELPAAAETACDTMLTPTAAPAAYETPATQNNGVSACGH